MFRPLFLLPKTSLDELSKELEKLGRYIPGVSIKSGISV